MTIPKCCIVTPTLDLRAGNRAVADAAASAGLACDTFVVEDVWGTGGCRPANEALKLAYAAGTPYVCYINDDVWFPQAGWLRDLVTALEADPKRGIAGPSGKCGTLPQKKGVPGMPRGVTEVKQLSYFCAAFKRAVFDRVGFLDEEFHHWGCDSDYNLRARRAGWKVVWARHVWVDHRTVPHGKRPAHLAAWKAHDVALFRRKKRGGG